MSDLTIQPPGWYSNRPHIAIAASGQNSKVASCGGDSGGPWFRAENVDKGPFYVVGVNNFGLTAGCGSRFKKSGFTRTSALQEWVESHTSQFKFNDEVSAPGSGGPPPLPVGPPLPTTSSPTSMPTSSPTPSPTSSGGSPKPPPPTCKDTSENKERCGYWKGKGYCTKYYEKYMKIFCANTCGTCSTWVRSMPEGSIEIPLPPSSTNAAGLLYVKTMFLGLSMCLLVFDL
jgi:hypothetical protein